MQKNDAYIRIVGKMLPKSFRQIRGGDCKYVTHRKTKKNTK